jgi:hypothetical protein
MIDLEKLKSETQILSGLYNIRKILHLWLYNRNLTLDINKICGFRVFRYRYNFLGIHAPLP